MDEQTQALEPVQSLQPITPLSQVAEEIQPQSPQVDDVTADDLATKLEYFAHYYTCRKLSHNHVFTEKDGEEHKCRSNATWSVMLAYNLDPDTQYGSAMSMGHQNLRKLQNLPRDYLESKGLNLHFMLDFAAKKMLDPQTQSAHRWWKDIMEVAEYKQAKALIEVNQNTQNNTFNINDPNVKDWNQKFLKFLETEV